MRLSHSDRRTGVNLRRCIGIDCRVDGHLHRLRARAVGSRLGATPRDSKDERTHARAASFGRCVRSFPPRFGPQLERIGLQLPHRFTDDDFRGYQGTVASGVLRVGDAVVSRSRRPANCAFSVRFSSRSNAIASRCSRSSHPSSATKSICSGNTGVSLRQRTARVFGH